MDERRSFGTLLRRVRKARDLTQEALAEQVYCAADTIKKIEAGSRRPSRQLAAQIAIGLGLSGVEYTAFLAAARACVDEAATTTQHLSSDSIVSAQPAPQHNLPSLPTPFVGRAQELAALQALLGDLDARLITIVGPGGIGKTRLAIEAARSQLEGFADGVYFVPLAALDDPDLLATPIAEALGVSIRIRNHREKSTLDGQQDQLVAYLRHKHMLLVLDNLEHLVGSLHLLSTILRTAPGVKILATSRERLNLHGETLFVLGGMIVPEGAAGTDAGDTQLPDAISLFANCARRIHPSFALTADNLGDVVAICRFVEGMPLGIELAAAWVGVLTPAEIAAEIQANLDFLSSSLHDIPERQRSIRSIFQSSWDKLSTTERDVFAQLSVFQGSFTREAAQRVTGASLQTLLALVQKSLVQPGMNGRYHVHELLRQFAAEQLGAVPEAEAAVRERHCAYYVGLLAEQEAEINGPRQGEALAAIEQEIYNVRAAWKWAVSQRHLKYIDQAMESLCEFYRMRGRFDEAWADFPLAAHELGWTGFGAPPTHADAAARFAETLQFLDAATTRSAINRSQEEILAKVLARDVRFHCEQPQNDRKAVEFRADVLKRLSKMGAKHEMAYVLRYAAHIEFTPWQTRDLYLAAITIFEEHGDERGIAETRYRLGSVAAQLGEYGDAEHSYQESLALLGRLGRREMQGNCLEGLSYVSWALGDYPSAEARCSEGRAIFASIGYRNTLASTQRLRARIALVRQDYVDAERDIRDSLIIYDEIGLLSLKAEALGELSHVMLLAGHPTEAEQLARESLTLCRQRSYRAGTVEPLMVLGQVACTETNWQAAKEYFRDCLQIAREVYLPAHALHALSGVVTLLSGEGKHTMACEVATFVRQHRASWQWTKDRVASAVAGRQVDGRPEGAEKSPAFADDLALDGLIDWVVADSSRILDPHSSAAPPRLRG
jgi:predicted ATPase/transcriptional regulator with XRE-family HTH domain